MTAKKGILERLSEGPVIGDGGFLFCLERRGYVKPGPWTPEATVEHPEAVRQLHREFLRSGSDVMQTFTFYSSDDKLETGGSELERGYTCADINQAGCDIARQVANEGGALVAGGLSPTPCYYNGGRKDEVMRLFRKQMEVFTKNQTDFMICEYFPCVEELEWAIEAALTSGQPVAASLCIGPGGDLNGVPVAECAVRMAQAGADIVGVNCNFDYNICLTTIAMMKAALQEAGLTRYLIVQPPGYHTPDVEHTMTRAGEGYLGLPEYPLALESRLVTRWDMHKFARAAYELGVRYIGGCCGTEPYHIRAMAEELSPERGGKLPAATDKALTWGAGMAQSAKPYHHERVGREYWENVQTSCGRPFCRAAQKLANNK